MSSSRRSHRVQQTRKFTPATLTEMNLTPQSRNDPLIMLQRYKMSPKISSRVSWKICGVTDDDTFMNVPGSVCRYAAIAISLLQVTAFQHSPLEDSIVVNVLNGGTHLSFELKADSVLATYFFARPILPPHILDSSSRANLFHIRPQCLGLSTRSHTLVSPFWFG
ncbi:hypothetical protein SCHPADRAFT_132135 [Schizopora paradoxa]|uniref:Uncharacterized protein n=1 Tax=Schizopora paradoxa TaxID=27342 RepID=A0A0H2S2A8_9AGAM|nr:hypothetical protein SCHPADRAFT_132135 [Schizopora paradoxa]